MLGVLVISSAKAQNVTYGNTNTWGLLLNSFKFNNKWSLLNEVHHRTGAFLEDKSTFIFRPAIVYHPNENTELSVGYSYLRNWPHEPSNTLPIATNEHNVWSQVLMKWQVGGVKFQNRFRQENRYIDTINHAGSEPQIGGARYANRFRYRLTASFDIVKLKTDGRSIFVNLFDEIWVDQGNNLMPTHFARNWFYAGLGYKINEDHNVQLGVMNQYDVLGNNNFISSNILQLTVFKGFNFTAE